MPGPIHERDGTVISSSQHRMKAFYTDRRMPCLLGVILNVQVSDDHRNLTAQQRSDGHGIRHECTVLATDTLGKQPDILLRQVIIPPMRHSGIDNYEEDLPRGCSFLVDESNFDTEFKKISYSKLDGEWCIVGFVGGNFESPFIQGWWAHPSNIFDLATTGDGYDGQALKQYDGDKDRSRFIRRVNGTFVLVNKHGSVYLDTSESNSKVTIKDGVLTRKLVEKGGHIQVDIEKSAQFEINFNEKEHKNPRLGAGSNSSAPVTDVDLPHPDQPVSGSPKARSTVRTLRRSTQWETLEKTSNYNLKCEDTTGSGGEKGEAAILADDTIALTVSKGGAKGTMINIVAGKIQIWNNDGTEINILADEVQIATKSGAWIDVVGSQIKIGGKVDISGPLAVGGVGEPTIKATTYQKSEAAVIGALATYLGNAAAAWKDLAANVSACAGTATPASSTANLAALAATALATALAAKAFSTLNLTST